MTLLGIGEKALSHVSTLAPCLLSALPCDSYLSVAVGRSRRMLGVGRRATFLATSCHAGVVSDGLAADESGRAL
jgi:hypothetical protein